jgi:DNA invertase Pin-like site-specific DNA recombinase
MMGVFAEFERAMIRDRVKAGLPNARAKGARLGAPRTDDKMITMIEKAKGLSRWAIAAKLDLGTARCIGC